ncbi:MAG: SdpI family protein [Saprospiraceae bacterium]|nr:SdpI family protein [Saprospiraceae bacterium]
MTVLVYLILSPLLLIISMVLYYFQPKKINPYYGYRTKRSMRDQQSWQAANDYSSRLFVIIAVVLNIVQGVACMVLASQVAFILVAILMVLSLIAIIPLTERRMINILG